MIRPQKIRRGRVRGKEKKEKEKERGTSSLRGINRGDIITEINAALSFRWQPKLPTVLAFISRTIIWSCFSILSFFYPFHLRKVIWGREGTVLNFTYPWELDLLVALLAPRATNSVFFLPIISAKCSNEENVSSHELPLENHRTDVFWVVSGNLRWNRDLSDDEIESKIATDSIILI